MSESLAFVLLCYTALFRTQINLPSATTAEAIAASEGYRSAPQQSHRPFAGECERCLGSQLVADASFSMSSTMANNATSPMTPGKRKGPRLVDEASLPVTPQSEPITPHKVRSDIDRHIDRLNGTWNLGLPIIRGAAASQMESSKALAKKLSARIRYLSFRAHSLDSLIDDFEERARLIYSSWKFKPNMQPGVILVRNASEQNLEGAAMKRKRHSLSERQIDQLLRCFDGVLKDVSDACNQYSAYQVRC